VQDKATVKRKSGSDIPDSVIRYGLDIFIRSLLFIIITVFIGAVIGMLWQTLLLLAFSVPLRQNAVGFHLRSRLACFLLSEAIMILSVYLTDIMTDKPLFQSVVFSISALLIFLWAPIGSNSKALDDKEKYVYRNRSRCLIVMYAVLFVIASAARFYSVSSVCSMAAAISAALLMLSKLQGLLFHRI